MGDVQWTGEGWAVDTTPSHYKGNGEIQPWHVIDAFQLDYYKGNALKYILRSGKKGSLVEDLRKAQHYLQYLIDRAEEAEPDVERLQEEQDAKVANAWHEARATARAMAEADPDDEPERFSDQKTVERLQFYMNRWHNAVGGRE